MSRCSCGTPLVEDAECAICSTDCITALGKGDSATRPTKFYPKVDPDSDNLYSYSASGQLVILPSYIITRPSCQAYNSVNISIPNDDDTVVTFDSERYDTSSMHSTVTNTSRIVIPVEGVYLVTFLGSFAANAVGERTCWIRKNGKERITAQEKVAVNGAAVETGIQCATQAFLEVNDYVEVIVEQESGGALNLLGTSKRYSPILSVRFRRPTPV